MRRYLNAIKAEIEMNLKEALSYKVGVISDLIVISILYFSLLFLDTGTMLGVYYGGNTQNSKPLLLLGYIFWGYSINAISTVSSEIHIEAVKGTLEQKFMSVIPFALLLFGKIITGIIIETLVISIIILLSIL